MGKPKKKGTSGAAAGYLTRGQAVRKMQLSIGDFRKMCILKGIYPREPPKKSSGTDKSYYLTKDIKFMMHDPVLDKLREHRVWEKKVKKAKHRKEYETVEKLMKNEPKYTLVHLVKERYPSFMDALKDLDDAITMINLFMLMPTEALSAKRVENCRRLSLEFQYYLIRTKALRKVFISIKGIYFQAEVMGQTVTWIVPHRFNQKLDENVDYKVMKTFLEFHEVLLGFVNYKLFNTLGVRYPLVLDAKKDGSGEGIRALQATSLSATDNPKAVPKSVLKATEQRIHTLDDLIHRISVNDAKEAAAKKSQEEEETSAPSTTAQQVAAEEQGDVFDEDERKAIEQLEAFKNLFSKCVVWISREVPREHVEFIVRAFGGQVAWSGCGTFEEDSTEITHQIVDRGTEPADRRLEREYVQPQWVFDCVNARILLPVDLYAPTAKLPPHLSPFTTYGPDSYIPDFQKKIQEYVAASNEGQVGAIAMDADADADAESSDESDVESEDDEAVYARELAAERRGKYAGDEDSEEEDEESDAENGDKMDVDEAPKEEWDYVDPLDEYMVKHSYKNRGIIPRFDQKKRKRTEAEQEEEDAAAIAQSMLPAKKRKLLQHVQLTKKRKEHKNLLLEEKKKKVANKELTVNSQGILVKSKEEK